MGQDLEERKKTSELQNRISRHELDLLLEAVVWGLSASHQQKVCRRGSDLGWVWESEYLR